MQYMQEVLNLIDLNQNKSLNEIIYEGLRNAIIAGIIPMNERINEKKYSEYLNVSRTPIREALGRIQQEGLVKNIPNYGIVVTQFTVKDVKEIYQIRLSLDVLAAQNAMHLMTPEHFDAMHALLTRTQGLQDADDVEGVIELSREFNNMLYECSNMPHLAKIQRQLTAYIKRFRDISLTANARRQRALDEHFLIYRCLLNQDEEQVRMIMTEHLELSRDFVLLEVEKEIEANKKR